MLKMFNYLKMLKQASYLNMYVGRRGRRIMAIGFGLIYLVWAFQILHIYYCLCLHIYYLRCSLSAVIGGCESEDKLETRY